MLTTGYPTAGLETVVELGRRGETSGAIILRFIGKLGLASYPEYREALRDDLTATLESLATIMCIEALISRLAE